MPPKTRHKSGEIDPEFVFPALSTFSPPTQLPTLKSVLGVLQSLTSGGSAQTSHTMAVNEVAKQIFSKYYHDTVYCLSIAGIKKRLTKVWSEFREGRKRFAAGRKTGKPIDDLIKMVEDADKLFDVSCTTPAQMAKCKEDWGVTMSDQEHLYYQDQKSERKMICDRQVDPVWYCAMMRRERLKSRQEEYRTQREEQFKYKDLDEITAILEDEMGLGSLSPEKIHKSETPEKSVEPEQQHQSQSKRRKLFVDEDDNDDEDQFPSHLAHVRTSERKVKDNFYLTVANLSGHGMSVRECHLAVVEVANGMFQRNWKLADIDSDTFDSDTLPDTRATRIMMEKIETETLSNIVTKITDAKADGRMITASIDSTTKKNVGKFTAQGISIGQNCPLPLPLLGISGESTEEVALQVDMAMELLAACHGTTAKEVYGKVDCHMTDSVGHNKGINLELQSLYDLDKPAGQLFCGSHTTLGFSSVLNKKISQIETDMKVDQVISKFMVSMDLDSKNGSLAGQALDMCLKLVAPEYGHKSWNYNKEFINFLDQKNIKKTLFCYKDQRFGCLSRASAVLLFNLPHLEQFLASNPQISNRLACLVRELLELPYLKVVWTVFGAVGIHIIEPFYSKTIDKRSTHSSLKEFYKILHNDLGKQYDDKFFDFKEPVMESEETDLFQGVSFSYGEAVVKAVREAAEENMEECVTLLNLCLPEMKTVLARQRRDYGISDEFEPEYPVFDQAANVDDTPVNNIAMERVCGKVDQRLKKLGQLESVSRSIILSRSAELRDGKESEFRGFKAEVQMKKQLELQWKQQTKEKFAQGATEKQVSAQAKERKRLDILDNLKEQGGPFTDAEQVQEYLDKEDITDKIKQVRMKKEIQFARESSTTLPSVDPLFKIQVTLPTGKRRDKTYQEFGEALMTFLGKKSDTNIMDYSIFVSSLNKFSGNNDKNND